MGDNDDAYYSNNMVYQCPSYASALGYMGVVAAVTLSNMGSAVRVGLLIFSFVDAVETCNA